MHWIFSCTDGRPAHPLGSRRLSANQASWAWESCAEEEEECELEQRRRRHSDKRSSNNNNNVHLTFKQMHKCLHFKINYNKREQQQQQQL